MAALPGQGAYFPFAPSQDEGNDDRRNMADAPLSSAARILAGTAEAAADIDGPPDEAKLAALRSLKGGLSNLPHDEKSALVHAQRINPDLVDDEHLMGFLEAEDFDVDLAMARVLRYWKNRYKVFGPEKFALPMTLGGAMKDDITALKNGPLLLLPMLDEAGRAIIYRTTSHHATSDERIRVWWYLVHVAMENPSSRKNGFVALANGRGGGMEDFDPKWALAACASGDRYFPIRWKSAHICHANAVFPYVTNAVKAVLSPAQRKSFALHNGSDERVVETLSSYSLPKACIPTEIGGSLDFSQDAFIRERLAFEGVTNNVDEKEDEKETSKSSAAVDASVNDVNKNGSEMNVEAEQIVPISSTSAQMPQGGVQDFATKQKPGQQKRSKTKPKKARVSTAKGRVGDPRMNRALQARLDNPDLSLVAALMAGGFVFSDYSEPGAKVSETKDADGVTLYQRRNQLLRRLRLEKKKAGK